MPIPNSIVAALWRRSWKQISGEPALSESFLNSSRISCPGWMCIPKGDQNTIMLLPEFSHLRFDLDLTIAMFSQSRAHHHNRLVTRMPYRILCNCVKREGVEVSPNLASGLFS